MKSRENKSAFFVGTVFVLLLSLIGCGSVNRQKGRASGSVVERVCRSIYEGDFVSARQSINHLAKPGTVATRQLEGIVSEYELIERRRRTAKQEAYEQKITQLDKLRAAADANGLDDVNDITKVLSVVAVTSKLATQQQKDKLLARRFVKRTFSKALAKAAEFESKGKWIDAYTSYHLWLEEIEPENKAYGEYAEQLREKAAIVASFQDSPCETRQQRYEGVQKQMFVRVIETLRYNYVSVLDYRQMASKALNRCIALADVMKFGSGVSGMSFEVPGSSELDAWSGGLVKMRVELDRSALGVSKDKFLHVFERVLELNATTVKFPERVLIAQFSEAALLALDPYTVLIWPKHVQDFEKLMTNEFTGIGVEISKAKGVLTVVSLLPDTPAYNSGLDAEDVIEAVDGVPTKDMTISCAVKSITGPAGTQVTLTIGRAGWAKPREMTITRARIIVPTIRGWQRSGPAGFFEATAVKEGGTWRYMIDDEAKIGYVRITSFGSDTASDMEKILVTLEKQGLRALILDLRNNTGGLLTSAVEISDKFLSGGLIVKTVPRFGISTYAAAHKKKTHPDYPLVVLINSRSASASEIVAGALGDAKHERAILIGERTHGKGSVQGISHHPGEGAQLKYTMAYYHLPSGQRVESRDAMAKQGRNDWGVGPDVEVKLTPDESKNLYDVQRGNDVLAKADHDIESKPLKKYTIKETLEADPQLAVGLLAARAKLIEQGVLTARLN